MTDAAARVRLYTRAGCHLCEPAEGIVRAVAEQAGAAVAVVDVDAPPAWAGDPVAVLAAFSDKVPAVTVDGALVAYWRVSADALRRALAPTATG